MDALGIFGIASSLGPMAAPVVGLFLYEQVGSAAFFGATLATAVVSIVFAALYKDEYRPAPREPQEKRRFRLGSVLELSVLLPCIVWFLALFGFSAVNNFAITCGESRGIQHMSLFFTVHNVAIVITRLFAARLRGVFSTRSIIAGGLAVITGGILLLAFAGDFLMMMAASVIMAIGGTVYSQYLQADILLRVAEDRKGVANSTMMLFQDVGGGVGAAVFGVTSQYLGYAVTFIAASAVCGLAIPFTLKDKNNIS